jgi:carbon storage regulator
MLVLSRKTGERIMIGENIVLTVLGVCGNKVRLGVEAPRDLSIYREEIHRRRQDASRHEAQDDERALLGAEDDSLAPERVYASQGNFN